ncbi:hypothetical protein HPB47_009241, partial [Ixodes persulcatus]
PNPSFNAAPGMRWKFREPPFLARHEPREEARRSLQEQPLDHDQECPENPVFCAYCEGEVLRKDKSKHASECPMRLVYCENCEGFYAYALKKDHDQECLEKRVVCDDCKGEVLRKEKSRHASECPMRAVCCENCGGFYAYSSEKEHREQCEIKKPACEYCKLDLKGDVEKAIDTISELQQKIKDMERCNMSQQEEAKNKEAKLVKKIQELENRQMSKQEETRNENAKLVNRIQELENRQLCDASSNGYDYHVAMGDGALLRECRGYLNEEPGYVCEPNEPVGLWLLSSRIANKMADGTPQADAENRHQSGNDVTFSSFDSTCTVSGLGASELDSEAPELCAPEVTFGRPVEGTLNYGNEKRRPFVNVERRMLNYDNVKQRRVENVEQQNLRFGTVKFNVNVGERRNPTFENGKPRWFVNVEQQNLRFGTVKFNVNAAGDFEEVGKSGTV